MKKLMLIAAVLMLMPFAASAGEMELGGFGYDDIHLNHASLSGGSGPITASVSQRYGKAGGDATTNRSQAGLHYNDDIHRFWRWTRWADETFIVSRVEGVKENRISAGATFTAYDTEETKFALSAGAMHHSSDFDSGAYRSQFRASFRLKWKRETEDTMASVVAFYQPDVQSNNDYLASAVVQAALKLGDGHSFKVSVEDYYKSAVPGGQKRNHVYWLYLYCIEWGEK